MYEHKMGFCPEKLTSPVPAALAVLNLCKFLYCGFSWFGQQGWELEEEQEFNDPHSTGPRQGLPDFNVEIRTGSNAFGSYKNSLWVSYSAATQVSLARISLET